ncbi:MAG: FAD-dependent oxidoreductase [Proteobacteria bacterium]|nr:FAD-dependent oxidoreductase [Pseudomonadota bacterium]MBU1450546.1 FAD-dependent oxidoreductase [Pseudomonadota bacterium]MBU2468404.1 FAD-dependent oxidoreductase [Pseudomonadota bacterium]MBU2519231.1 FAD-dependent oxidoreductase [Pseudomonadota bacterium]
MQREINSLGQGQWDLVVVGGGIYGAAAAWEAARRGLGVVLLEAGDFGGATSANSLKVIHGGFRYLQSMDLARVRLSAAELVGLMLIAPHLVSPLPCLVPTKGLGKQGRPAFAVALAIYNYLTGHEKLRGKLLGKAETVSRCGLCLPEGFSGGVLWHDGLVHDSERLSLSYVLSASELGAQVANYARVIGLLSEGGRTAGVRVRDELNGQEMEVRGKVVLSTAGPWALELFGQADQPPALASALNLVVRRSLGSTAVGLRSLTSRADDPVCGGRRFMFMVPWHGHTLLGTAYRVWQGPARPAGPSHGELLALLDEFNAACPELELTPGDIAFYHWGLVPLEQPGKTPVGGGLASKRRLLERPGLIAVSGAKYTTARAVAAEAVARACAQLGQPAPELPLAPLWGGEPEEAVLPGELSTQAAAHLRAQYGSRAGEVAGRAGGDADLLGPLAPDTPVLGCEVVQAVEAEMAQHLADVSLRRTVLGKMGRPSDQALSAAADIMAARLGWDQERREAEMAQALKPYAILEGLA